MSYVSLEENQYVLNYFLKYRYRLIEVEKGDVGLSIFKDNKNEKSLYLLNLARSHRIFSGHFANRFLFIDQNQDLLFLYGFLGVLYPSKKKLDYDRYFYPTRILYKKQKIGFFSISADNIFFTPRSLLKPLRYRFYGIRRFRTFNNLLKFFLNYFNNHNSLQKIKIDKFFLRAGFILLNFLNIFEKGYYLINNKILGNKYRISSLLSSYFIQYNINCIKKKSLLSYIYRNNVFLLKINLLSIQNCLLVKLEYFFFFFNNKFNFFVFNNKKILYFFYWFLRICLLNEGIFLSRYSYLLYNIFYKGSQGMLLSGFPDKSFHNIILKRLTNKNNLKIFRLKTRIMLIEKLGIEKRKGFLRRVSKFKRYRKKKKRYYTKLLLLQLQNKYYLLQNYYFLKRIIYFLFFYKKLLLNSNNLFYKDFVYIDFKLSVQLLMKNKDLVKYYLEYKYYLYLYLYTLYNQNNIIISNNFLDIISLKKILYFFKKFYLFIEKSKEFINFTEILKKEVTLYKKKNWKRKKKF